MSSNRRKREYERRRYEDWQRKLGQKQARRRRTQRNAGVVASAVAVVAVILGSIWFVNRDSGSATATPTASPSASTSASSSAGASASDPAAADPDNPCPAPTVQPPATPLSFPKAPDKSTAEGKTWKVSLTTSCGPIVLTLDGAKAPQATAATLLLARSKFWDGSPCHRLTTAGIFVLQCGDPTGTGTGGPGFEYGPVENAPTDNVYKRGVVAMARTSDPNSMGSQFFLVYKDTTLPGGYTVMGTVSSGLDIVDKIAAGGDDGKNGEGDGAPKRAISIVSSSVAPG